jgi:hypothetical protein
MGRWGNREEGGEGGGGGISEGKIGDTGLSREGSVTVGQALIFEWRGNISIRSEKNLQLTQKNSVYMC